MIVTLTPDDSGGAPSSDRIPPTISLTHASASKEKTVAMPPPIIKGFRFPQLTRQLSLLIPTYGCTKVPVKGPAIHTNASNDLLIPSESKYGCKVR